ncbi:MAG TPA: hypothetical protein VG604_00990 [Candidatus Saccharimonadales bacterium]|nr:hypothetical protein [Candidatus Saccharimonadales bacterium]
MAGKESNKRVAITKANAQTVAIVAVASFVTVFCLIASKTVLSTNLYQSKVTSQQQKALTQLKSNLQAFDTLVSSYDSFTQQPINIIGGSRTGSHDNDGDNAKIILDALPYQYDFPALTASIEKILHDRGISVSSIGGTDDPTQTGASSATPVPVAMPFSFAVDHLNYKSAQQLILALQQSIRPIQIDSLTVSGSNEDMTLTINAHTYFQPAKLVNISQQVVK